MKKANQTAVAAATVAAPAKATKAANIIETLVNRNQHFIYKVQAQEQKLDPKKAKQHRQKMRRMLENFYFKICLQKSADVKKQALTDFLAFYKEHYIMQDFSLASLTDSRDEGKRESYTQLLKAAQEYLSK